MMTTTEEAKLAKLRRGRERLIAAASPSRKRKTKLRRDIERHTPRSQVDEAHSAFLYAEQQGTPLNLFLTILYRDHKDWKFGTRNPTERRKMMREVRESVRHAISD